MNISNVQDNHSECGLKEEEEEVAATVADSAVSCGRQDH